MEDWAGLKYTTVKMKFFLLRPKQRTFKARKCSMHTLHRSKKKMADPKWFTAIFFPIKSIIKPTIFSSKNLLSRNMASSDGKICCLEGFLFSHRWNALWDAAFWKCWQKISWFLLPSSCAYSLLICAWPLSGTVGSFRRELHRFPWWFFLLILPAKELSYSFRSSRRGRR